MNILIINGPNLNVLELRDSIYGNISYEELCETIKQEFSEQLTFFQSNFEGEIVEKIQQAVNNYDALVINPAAFTHYSYAIRDALEIFKSTKVEVHLTDIENREQFRKINVIKDVVETSFMGEGVNSYIKAIKYCIDKER